MKLIFVYRFKNVIWILTNLVGAAQTDQILIVRAQQKVQLLDARTVNTNQRIEGHFEMHLFQIDFSLIKDTFLV